MNVIFAFLMAALAYRLGVPELPCKVSDVFSGGAAWQAGMKVDDEIVQIGDLEKPRYEDLQTRVPLSNVEEGIEFVVKRRGVDDLISLKLYPENRIGIPLIGVGGPQKMEIAKPPTARFSAARKAEPPLLEKDRIVAVNGTPVSTPGELNRELALHQAKEITLSVERDVAQSEGTKSSNEVAADGKPKVETKRIDIVIPPAPWRHFGMSMRMGPISCDSGGLAGRGEAEGG